MNPLEDATTSELVEELTLHLDFSNGADFVSREQFVALRTALFDNLRTRDYFVEATMPKATTTSGSGAPKITILDPGFTGCYIHDLSARGWRVKRLFEVNYEAAVGVVHDMAPEARMGGCLGKELTFGRRAHQWHNKTYVIMVPGLALFNQDGTIYLYAITKEA